MTSETVNAASGLLKDLQEGIEAELANVLLDGGAFSPRALARRLLEGPVSAALASTAGAGAGDWADMSDEGSAAWSDRVQAALEAWRKYHATDGTDVEQDDADFCAMAEALHVADGILSAVPASPRSGAGEGEELRQAAQPLADIAAQWDDIRSGNPEAPDGTLVSVSLGELRALNRSLSQGGGAGRSERAVEIRELSEKATTGAPCHWGGGNDIIWCSTCGAEYAYAKGEERPACPRLAAPAQSPSTSDREG